MIFLGRNDDGDMRWNLDGRVGDEVDALGSPALGILQLGYIYMSCLFSENNNIIISEYPHQFSKT